MSNPNRNYSFDSQGGNKSRLLQLNPFNLSSIKREKQKRPTSQTFLQNNPCSDFEKETVRLYLDFVHNIKQSHEEIELNQLIDLIKFLDDMGKTKRFCSQAYIITQTVQSILYRLYSIGFPSIIAGQNNIEILRNIDINKYSCYLA